MSVRKDNVEKKGKKVKQMSGAQAGVRTHDSHCAEHVHVRK